MAQSAHEILVRDLHAYALVTAEPLRDLLRRAADALRLHPAGLSDSKRLEDPQFLARGYRADVAEDNKEIRLVFFGDLEQKRVLGYMPMTTPETYEAAQYLLKQYDVMEGIK